MTYNLSNKHAFRGHYLEIKSVYLINNIEHDIFTRVNLDTRWSLGTDLKNFNRRDKNIHRESLNMKEGAISGRLIQNSL